MRWPTTLLVVLVVFAVLEAPVLARRGKAAAPKAKATKPPAVVKAKATKPHKAPVINQPEQPTPNVKIVVTKAAAQNAQRVVRTKNSTGEDRWHEIEECAKEKGLEDILKQHTQPKAATTEFYGPDPRCNTGFLYNAEKQVCEASIDPAKEYKELIEVVEPGTTTTWIGEFPKADLDDVCGTRALFPTTDRCWGRWYGKSGTTYCDVANGGFPKSSLVAAKMFTKGFCACDDLSDGDGFSCYAECTRAEKQRTNCPADRVCRKFTNGTLYCGCAIGFRYVTEGSSSACVPTAPPCDACQFDCHVSSKCAPIGELSFGCTACNNELGFEEVQSGSASTGRSCKDVDECAGNNECDTNADCVNQEVLTNGFGFKYTCHCKKGWRGTNQTGTKCNPCRDENECILNPGICGAGSICRNTQGSYVCTCKPGYQKNSAGNCVDIDECLSSPCHRYAKCENTEGSYKCTCLEGFRNAPQPWTIPPQVYCELDPAFHCKKCDNATTTCALVSGSYQCQCKKNHVKVDSTSCKPKKWCENNADCAPIPKGRCIELQPAGSGYRCECEKDYEGDGKNCKSRNVCVREAPCALVPHADCITQDGIQYNCVCEKGFVRQLAEEGNRLAPCYNINSSHVNNCSICDPTTQDCKPVLDLLGKPDKNFKTCYCKDGYEARTDGRSGCTNINECESPLYHNCDAVRAKCIDKIPHLDGGKKFECRCNSGYKGDGTLNSCKNINECVELAKKPCSGAHMKCEDTPGSYNCYCSEGYRMIAGMMVCLDIDECRANPCPARSQCFNIEGSYECRCSKGYEAKGQLLPKGSGTCEDIDECKIFPTLYKKSACDETSSTCRNTPGSFECDCKRPYFTPIGGICEDVDECKDNTDSCDKQTTVCQNKRGGYNCACKRGFQRAATSNDSFSCDNINECTAKTAKCNENSECIDTIGGYYCKCNKGFKNSPTDFNPVIPVCVRESVCGVDKCLCGSCVDTDTPPYYKCICPYGSFMPNDTICLGPKYCDDIEYTCGDNAECVNGECVCDENYEWMTFPGPYTAETMKNRPGCDLTNLCERQGCPVQEMKCSPLPVYPFKACECPQGTEYSRDVVACIDINECLPGPIQAECPKNSHCVNYNRTFACECDEGYYNDNTDAKTRHQFPVCKNTDECSAGTHNCSRIPNSFCKDLSPGFCCQCKQGYFKTAERTRNCGHAKKCLAETCADINECLLNPCPADSKCTNTDGSFYCECNKGFRLEKGVCVRENYCNGEGGGHNCTRFENCVLTDDFFKCECQDGYERNLKIGNCTYIPVCGTSKDTCKPRNMKCVDDGTNGRHTCQCKPHQKFINNECIDINPCTFNPCPPGDQNICVNDKSQTDGYRCDCAKDYTKDPKCMTAHRNNCTCIPENLCEKYPCPKNSQCQWKNNKRTCVCNDGFQMSSAKEECISDDGCKLANGKPKCSEYEDCESTGPGKAKCVCKETSAQFNNKCVKNPCEGFVCPATARSLLTSDSTGPICVCKCEDGFKLEGKECKAIDPCGCSPGLAPCKNSKACESVDQECRVWDDKAHCDCPIGWEWNSAKKICEDYNECKNNTFCPPDTKCENLPGSYKCTCSKRGMIFDQVTGQCIPDVICSQENNCRDDVNKVCKRVNSEQTHCVCVEPYQGSGKPGEQCTPIDYCALPAAKDVCGDVAGSMKVIDAIGKICKCTCKSGCQPKFSNAGKLQSCEDVDECAQNPKICVNRLHTKCVNNANLCGGYDCVCEDNYKLNATTGTCDQINWCQEKKIECGEHGTCEPRTGACICAAGFTWDHTSKSCIDINECDNWPCGEHEICVNEVPGYQCFCEGGYVRDEKTKKCIDDNECKKPFICPNVSECDNLPGGYRCKCHPGYIQNGEFDCAVNSTCSECPDNSHCIRTFVKNTAFNCTCDDGFEKIGDKCENINECKDATRCLKNATCIDLTPGFKCKCNEPLVGDGAKTCELPQFCDPSTGYNDCPADSKCVPKYPGFVDSKGKTHYVSCACTLAGFKFDEEKRTCEDIDECKNSTTCVKDSTCKNSIGSYSCTCNKPGFKWNPDTNKCENIDECACTSDGCYDKTKCSLQSGRCQDTDGSWICMCNVNYGHPKATNDNQTCERITYCGTELDKCDKQTTKCRETNDGFACDCISGFIHVPNTNNHVCEDKNECVTGEHNCTGFQQCTNTVGSFYCNCTNDISHKTGDDCVPVSDCKTPLNCGPYGFSKQDKDGKCKCYCLNRYQYVESVKACIPVDTCSLPGECPLNSDCRLVQRQNETTPLTKENASGTASKCVCREGYEMINFQCHQKDICKEQPTICGAGAKCIPDSVEPYKKYSCSCPPGATEYDTPDGKRCEKASCDTRNPCDTQTAVCNVVKSSVVCSCKPGYQGVGTIDNPCLPVHICRDYNPCSRFATCVEKDGIASCKCNAGYQGNGTYCTDIDECTDKSLNDCKGSCINTQGSFTCVCPDMYEGDGRTCTPIQYCAKHIDECDRESTTCVQLDVGYNCSCKTGYEQETRFKCKDTNECLNNPCYTHPITNKKMECINKPGTYECVCTDGFLNINPQTCKDDNECLRDVCLSNSFCENLEGSFKCSCYTGYRKKWTTVEKRPLDYVCEIIDVCKEVPEICDTKTSYCRMVPNVPAHECVCFQGYSKKAVGEACTDIDECTQNRTVVEHLKTKGINTTCTNTIGSFELKCKEGYTKDINATTELLVCAPINECASDPAWAKAEQIISDFKKLASSGLSISMANISAKLPKPEVKGSPYAQCYETERFPMCVDMAYDSNMNAQLFEFEFPDELKEHKGWGCRCPDGSDPIKEGDFMVCQKTLCQCLGENVERKCVNGVAGQCTCITDPVKKYYKRRQKNGNLYCSEHQCDDNSNLTAFKNGFDVDISCTSGILIVSGGWEIVVDDTNEQEYTIKDIDECAKSNPCCEDQNCVGSDCVKCINTPGSYECKIQTSSGDFQCLPGKFDTKTCLCGEAVCNVKQAWFYGCSGCNVATRTFVNDTRPVCSKILNDDGSALRTFPSLKELLTYTCSLYLNGDQGICAMNMNADPNKANEHPTFNYFGACDETKPPTCEAGASSIRSTKVSSVNRQIYVCNYGKSYTPGQLPAGSTTENASATTYCRNQYSSPNWLFQVTNSKLVQRNVST